MSLFKQIAIVSLFRFRFALFNPPKSKSIMFNNKNNQIERNLVFFII